LQDLVVHSEVVGSQLVLTLNDPPTRNALSNRMAVQLIEQVRHLDKDASLRVGIITGTGSSFCSGADLNDRKVHATSDVREHVPRRRRTIFETVSQCAKPIIAAINGPAVGAGANLAIACDLRICAEDGWLQWPQAKLGILPGSGTLARLFSTVGVARAMEWTLSCTKVDAATGREAGLFNAVTSGDELLNRALALGGAIAESAPLSVRFIKESLASLVTAQAERTADADEYRSFILFNTRERQAASEDWRQNREARHADGSGPAIPGPADPVEGRQQSDA
jgi:enoyl-CoA hydratase/carnithine racemase